MTIPSIELHDWGQLEYSESLSRQHELVAAKQQGNVADRLILVEHPHVITLGRRRSARDNVLAANDVPVVEVERGGDATYHGPGQIVLYPIVELQEHERDLHQFLRNLESGIISTLQRHGLDAGRETGKTGVWRNGRKLASMGIACRQWITFHGLALNVSTDLSYFQRINPCGFSSSIMSNVDTELGRNVDMANFKIDLAQQVASAIGRRLEML